MHAVEQLDAGTLNGVSESIALLRSDPKWQSAADLLDAIVLLRGDRVEYLGYLGGFFGFGNLFVTKVGGFIHGGRG